jgi:hypothetical protein
MRAGWVTTCRMARALGVYLLFILTGVEDGKKLDSGPECRFASARQKANRPKHNHNMLSDTRLGEQSYRVVRHRTGPHLLFLRRAKDSFHRVETGDPLGRSANPNFSSPRMVLVVLGGGGALAGRSPADSGSQYSAAGRAHAASARYAMAGISSCLWMRSSLVSRNLLLGV